MEKNSVMVPQLLFPQTWSLMLAYFKALYLFTKTLKYWVLSYFKPQQILQLKQKWASDTLNGLGYQIEVEGPPPENNQTTVLVGNHISYLDILALMSVNPHISFVAKKEVKSWPIIGPAARRVGTLFVDRSRSADRKKVREEISRELRSQTIHITVFPSGTTTLDENIPWKKGIFEIAFDHQIPVQVFSLEYEPKRISAYIDDDSLAGQMTKAIRTENKKVRLKWLETFYVQEPKEDAEKARQIVLKSLSANLP